MFPQQMESQVLERIILGEMRSLVTRARQLVADAERVFYDPELPLQVLGEASRLKMELQGSLSQLMGRIQLEEVDVQSGAGVPFWRNRHVSLYNAGETEESHGQAFEILFGATRRTNDTTGQCRIYTLDRRLNEQLPVSAELLNTACSFGNVVELARILSLEKPPGLDAEEMGDSQDAARYVGEGNGSYQVQLQTCSPRSPLEMKRTMQSQLSHTDESDENYDNAEAGACTDEVSEPPLLYESPTVKWRPLVERIALQQQRREQIQQQRQQQIREINRRSQFQHAQAVEKQSQKIKQYQEQQEKQLQKAAVQRKEHQQQRVLHAAQSAQKIEDARRKRQLERQELLEKIQRNWADNERRRREYFKAKRAQREAGVREADLGSSVSLSASGPVPAHLQQSQASQQQQQQILWAGYDGCLLTEENEGKKADWKEQLRAANKANERITQILAEQSTRQAGIAAANLLVDTAQAMTDFEILSLLLFGTYSLISEPGLLQQKVDSLSEYERQLVQPQVSAADIYIIPGLLDEALLLRVCSCALWRLQGAWEKGSQAGVFQTGQNGHFQLLEREEITQYMKGPGKRLSEKAREAFPVYKVEGVGGGEYGDVLKGVFSVLLTVLTEKLEFPALVSERFLGQAGQNQSKRLWVYDQLASFQAACVLLNQVFRFPLGVLPDFVLTKRLFELLSTQCAQLVLSPHCYYAEEDVGSGPGGSGGAGQTPGLLHTHQPMILEFQGLLQTFLQLLNTLLEKDAVLFDPDYLTQPQNTQIRQELQFVFIYTQSQKVFFHPDSSPAASAPARFPVFLPRISQNCNTMILQQQSIEPSIGSTSGNRGQPGAVALDFYIVDASNSAGKHSALFTSLQSLAAYPIAVASPVFTSSGAEFLQEKAVHPGLLQALRFFKLLAQAGLFERVYLRDFFQGAIPLFPPELFVSGLGCGLLREIAELFLLDVGELGG